MRKSTAFHTTALPGELREQQRLSWECTFKEISVGKAGTRGGVVRGTGTSCIKSSLCG